MEVLGKVLLRRQAGAKIYGWIGVRVLLTLKTWTWVSVAMSKLVSKLNKLFGGYFLHVLQTHFVGLSRFNYQHVYV